MPERILILTVGGSDVPIVDAIELIRPDYVHFIASKISRKQVTDATSKRIEESCVECGKKAVRLEAGPSIVAKVGLGPGQFDTAVLEAEDDFEEVVNAVRHAIDALRAANPRAEIQCNFTGGTKTMSAGLVVAALERSDVRLSLVVGNRTDAVQVQGRASSIRAVSTRHWNLRQTIRQAADLFDRSDYTSASAIIQDFSLQGALDASQSARLERIRRLFIGFEYWDRFDHPEAFRILREFAKQLGEHFQSLLRLTNTKDENPYAAVFDLIRNAERRAERQRYDDAVARLYRAVEMLAQVRLRIHGIDAGNVEPDRLPGDARERFATKMASRRPPLTVGREDAYWLLGELGDPLATALALHDNNLRSALTKRNNSILAHGNDPIERAAFQHLHGVVHDLLTSAEGKGIAFGPRPPQFPKFAEIRLD
jgi:CRISPR-associated protein (TIGR02710 family)